MIESASSVKRSNASDSLLAELVADFTNRLQAGEAVDVEVFIQQHLDQADSLRRLLPPLQVLAELGRSGEAGVATPLNAQDGEPHGGQLGDFRIVCEVGRGGMGIVYEAEQVSLRRRVALKVLPFAATLDPRRLQRFRNEATAAAQLHHTNIVPVHAVGCERGVHYYAMQYIEGQTLAAVIGELRRRKKDKETRRPEDSETIKVHDTIEASRPSGGRPRFRWTRPRGNSTAKSPSSVCTRPRPWIMPTRWAWFTAISNPTT